MSDPDDPGSHRVSEDGEDNKLVLRRLAGIGVECRDIYKLVGNREALDKAGPELARLLHEVSSPYVKKDLARVGAEVIPASAVVAELKRLRPSLRRHSEPRRHLADLPVKDFIGELRRIREQSTGRGAAAWSLADALRSSADESVYADIVEMLQDDRYGSARKMLAYALMRVASRRDETIELLVGLLDDEVLTPVILDLLARAGVASALPAVAAYLNAEEPLVRSEARKAHRRLSRGTDSSVDDVESLQPASASSADGAASRESLDIEEGDDMFEASMNFDADRVAPFMDRIGSIVDGLDTAEKRRFLERLEEMEPEQEAVFEFDVRHQGKPTKLKVVVWLGDKAAPDIAFFTSQALAEEIDGLMDEAGFDA